MTEAAGGPPAAPPDGSPPGEPPDGSAPARGGWLGRVLLVVALGFVAFALVRNWEAVRADLRLLSWADLTGSSLAAAAAVLLTGLSWRLVLAGLGPAMAMRPALTLYSAGQLGKYVPGSVWVVAIQAELGRRQGIARPVMALSYAVAILVAVATGGFVGLLTLLGQASGSIRLLALLLGVGGVLAVLALVRPRLVNASIGWLARRLGRALPEVALPGRTLAGALALTTLAWGLFGVHAWLLARPLGAGPELLVPTTGAFAMAFVAGLLLVPLPAGAGVREGILVAMLAGSIGAPAALTVSLISRLVLVVVDLVLAGGLGVRRAGLRTPAG